VYSRNTSLMVPYVYVPGAIVVFVTVIVKETHKTGIGQLADVGWVLRLSERSMPVCTE